MTVSVADVQFYKVDGIDFWFFKVDGLPLYFASEQLFENRHRNEVFPIVACQATTIYLLTQPSSYYCIVGVNLQWATMEERRKCIVKYDISLWYSSKKLHISHSVIILFSALLTLEIDPRQSIEGMNAFVLQ